MVAYCCAFGCTNERTPGSTLRFHKFPLSRPDVLSLWIEAVGLKDFKPTRNTVICSAHFTEESYLESSLNKKLLKKDAVPSIFKFSEHVKEAEPAVPCRQTNPACIASTSPSSMTSNMEVSESNCISPLTKDVGVQTYEKRSLSEHKKVYKEEIRSLQQEVRRKSRKIKSMKELISHLKNKSKRRSDSEEILVLVYE